MNVVIAAIVVCVCVCDSSRTNNLLLPNILLKDNERTPATQSAILDCPLLAMSLDPARRETRITVSVRASLALSLPLPLPLGLPLNLLRAKVSRETSQTFKFRVVSLQAPTS